MIKPLLVATLAATVTAIPAQADGPAGDDPEDNYLYVLDSEGINPANDNDAVTAGYAICGEVASGVTPPQLMDGLAAQAPDLSAYSKWSSTRLSYGCAPSTSATTSPTADGVTPFATRGGNSHGGRQATTPTERLSTGV